MKKSSATVPSYDFPNVLNLFSLLKCDETLNLALGISECNFLRDSSGTTVLPLVELRQPHELHERGGGLYLQTICSMSMVQTSITRLHI